MRPAFVAAAERRLDEPVNVARHGAITALQAIRRGRPHPDPAVGPDWRVARLVSGLFGAPIPDHVSRRSTAGASPTTPGWRSCSVSRPRSTTVEVIDKLYAWPSIDPPAGPPGRSPDGVTSPSIRSRGLAAPRGDGAVARRAAATATVRWLGDWDVDDWGRDDTLVAAAARLGRLRWRTIIGGRHSEPTCPVSAAGALLVVNARRFGLTHVVGGARARPTRPGARCASSVVPTSPPVGPLARRLGGLLDAARRGRRRAARTASWS